MPTIKEMESFFPLYLDRKRELLESNHLKTDLSGDDSETVIEAFLKSSDTQKYGSFEEFLKHAIHLADE